MSYAWVVGTREGSIGETIMDLLREDGDRVLPSTHEDLDVRDWRAIDNFVKVYGPFDKIVYNAGIARLEWIKDLSEGGTEDVFSVNLFGFLGVLKSLVNFQTVGNVVVVASDAADVAMRGSMAYCTSKAALVHAVRVAARELAPKWRINAVSPAMVDDTNMTRYIDGAIAEFRGWTEKQAREYEGTLIPMGRRASRKEVADLVRDVLNGPKFMTGANVKLTGGK